MKTLFKLLAEDENLDTEYTKNIENTDLENAFHVYTDKNGKYMFNLNNTIHIECGNSYKLFEVKHSMPWPLISYKIYGTTRYAWLLMKLNNVTLKTIFDDVKSGTIIKYVSNVDLQYILNSIANMN